jgi:hypothetical protein
MIDTTIRISISVNPALDHRPDALRARVMVGAPSPFIREQSFSTSVPDT